MRQSFHRIAYEALDVCNAVTMAQIDLAIETTRLGPGLRAIDIGSGNGAVAIRLAERFGLHVDAVELDPDMAGLAASRIAAASGSGSPLPISLHVAPSARVLAQTGPFKLIVALGTTEPVGDGVRDPFGMFEGLRAHLVEGGWLLWGDLVWTDEPSVPLRQIVEMSNSYADDAGWRAAAAQAGFAVVSAEVSSSEAWDTYAATMQAAVAAWLAANPDHADAAAIAARAHQLDLMFTFGRGVMSFGLYLLRKA
ncbi:hypothetical protein BH10PSE2_BH10PSE2_13830 [soil metagenome]